MSSILDLGWILTNVCSDSLGNRSRGSWICSPSKHPYYLILKVIPISRVHYAPTRTCGGVWGKSSNLCWEAKYIYGKYNDVKSRQCITQLWWREARKQEKVCPPLSSRRTFLSWMRIRKKPATENNSTLPSIASWQRLTRLHFQYSQRIVNSGLWLHH